MENQVKITCLELKKQKKVKRNVETIFFKQYSELIPNHVNKEEKYDLSIDTDQISGAKVRRDVIICHRGFVFNCDTDTQII